jgi:hypothetical protein
MAIVQVDRVRFASRIFSGSILASAWRLKDRLDFFRHLAVGHAAIQPGLSRRLCRVVPDTGDKAL